MLSTVQEEGSEASGGVDRIVVGKFCSDKVLIPIIVVRTDVGTQHLDHSAIGSLRLSDGLGVTSGRHVEMGLEDALELDPEVARELGISV